jgi:hypothetical protein
MSFDARRLRLPALLAAAVVLPCCSGDAGKGSTVRIVTIRASETTSGVQGDGASAFGSFSADGRIVAFSSSATNLTPNDANDLSDIFVKDRVTGIIENITNVGNANNLIMGMSAYPCLSADGRYVGLLSAGMLQDTAASSSYAANPPILRPYLYDRVTKTFVVVLTTGFQFMNGDTYDISLSADGRYMAFSTISTNMTGINTQGQTQAYLCDFGPNHDTPVVTLISHTSGSATTGSNGGGFLGPGSISGDGDLVVFDSVGTDILPAQDADAGMDVYLYQRSTGIRTLVSIPSSGNSKQSFFSGISRDGTTIGYIYNDASLFPQPNFRSCQLYTVGTGLRKTISDPALGAQANTSVVLSADGFRVVYGVGTFGQPQQYLYIEGVGNQLLVRSTDGQTTTLSTNAPAISADGRWASWSTTATNMVSGDTNGVNDVFLRGPF